ncbi:MAG: cysteine desulfurase [Bacteroidaceae bacterium]|jgi:cysteine desulfurase/selenocysteine lyase|nr:cysteine desulfurase [Bacteroidaceae bacterium]MEE1147023.1 cysteine desulfurase [Bacteroidaceae bacterium]
MSYDLEQIRQDFPILQRQVYGRPLVYLDNGATTQKPRCVVEAMTEEYYNVNANVHRGVHFLSQKATDLHEQSRETVRRFLNANSVNEIIFTRGTTESMNLVASCFSEAFMQEGDEVIISTLEHHSNIVPWQLAQNRKGIKLRVIPITDEGNICLDEYEKLFTNRTRIVSVAHVSNVLGTINPVKEMIEIAHAHGVPVLIDGAQSTPHMAVDVQQLDCDFFAFSGHKMYGPTGVGVLYGREKWLDRLPPYMGGGEMIKRVSFEQTTFNELPYKFEAGTPDYIATTGLAQAIDYVCQLGMDNIEAHERDLAQYAVSRLQQIPGMHLYGPMAYGAEGAGPLSFNVEGIHHLDMGTLLDRLGVAVRTGHHCAEPLMHRLGVDGTVRASFGLYNTRAEIDVLASSIERVCKMFA